MRTTILVVSILAPLLLTPSAVIAQGPGSFEFGMDAGFNLAFVDDQDDNLFSVGIPTSDFGSFLQNWRIGYQTSEAIELEVPLGFALSTSGGDSFWRLGGGLGLLYNLPRRSDTQFYVTGSGLINVTGFDEQTESQFGVAAGAGVRLFLGSSWALRPELGGARMFPTDDLAGTWNVIGSIGLSFFTEPAGK